LLPKWKTYLLEAKIIDKQDFPKLSLRFLLNAHNEEEIKKWLSELQDSNKTTYSIYSTADSKGKYVNFKQRLVCQHCTRSQNVYDPSKKSRTSTKNTNCPSKITVVLHAIKKRYQGKDKEKHALMCEMPCEVTFITTHNHSTLSADSLRFRKISQEVKDKLLNLFHNGHSVSTALQSLKIDIQLNNDNYEEILADRKYCPTYDDCYHLYRQEFERRYGPKQWFESLYSNTSECYSNSCGSNETSKASAKSVLTNINAVFTQFIDRSPVEVGAALNSMYQTLQKIKNPSTFASYCINFGSSIHRRNRGNYIGIQSTSINRRKTNLSGKKTNVGGRPRKCTNKEYIKPSNGHNLSKRILSNRSVL
jgi:hypothetical protein